MNQIASVSGKNIKGRSFVHKLTPVTLIAGRNRRGKTTILDTIELAITSRTSSLRGANGKPVAQPREIFDALASSSLMSADVVYSDGTGCGISYTQARGTVSTKRTDGGPELPPIMLDPTEYTNLSEPDRVKYIFARANLAHLTISKLRDTVSANLKGIKLEENTPASESVITELVQFVRSHQGGQVSLTPQDWVANLIEDAKTKLSASNANVKRMEQTQQGMTQVAGDENPAPADSETRLLDARKALEAAQGDLTRLQTELETLKGLAASAGKAKALLETVSATDMRLKAVEARQGEIRAILAVPVDLTPAQDAYAAAQKVVNEHDLAVKAAEKAVSDVEAEILAAKELSLKAVDETALKADIARLESERDALAAVSNPGQKPVAMPMPTERPSAVGELASKNVMAAHADSAQRLEADAKAKVESLQAEIKLAKIHTHCPTCGHDITEKQKEIIHELERKLEAAAVALGKAKDTTEHNMQAFIIATNSYNAAVAAGEQWDSDQTELRVSNQNVLDAWNDLVANYNVAQSKINGLNGQIAAIQNQLAGNAKAHEAWVNLPTLEKKLLAVVQSHDAATDAYNTTAAKLDAADGELAAVKLKQSLQNDLATESRRLETERQSLVATLESVAAARAEVAKLPDIEEKILATKDLIGFNSAIVESHRIAVTLAEGHVRRLTQQRAVAKERAKTKEESDKVRVEAQVLKEFCRMLADMQSEIVNAAIGPIVDRLNVMFKGVLDMPLCYKDGVIGTESPTGFYSMRSFSGAEKALAMCAISLALAAASPVKIVVLDELGRLSTENKHRLVTLVLQLLAAGTISQAIFVDTTLEGYGVFMDEKNFSVIEL